MPQVVKVSSKCKHTGTQRVLRVPVSALSMFICRALDLSRSCSILSYSLTVQLRALFPFHNYERVNQSVNMRTETACQVSGSRFHVKL